MEVISLGLLVRKMAAVETKLSKVLTGVRVPIPKGTTEHSEQPKLTWSQKQDDVDRIF